MIADDAVMTDMGIGHDQVMVTDGGFAAVLHGATVNGDALANHIVITDHQARGLALVLQIGVSSPTEENW